MNPFDVCLQINVAPGDLRYVADILPHQLRVFGRQVDEIQFTLDTQQSRAFRSATTDYGSKLDDLRKLLESLCLEFPQASIVEVDYSDSKMRDVAQVFIGGDRVPRKACDGSAFYAYLYGFYHARSNFILHIDSDMLFGGGSQCWVREAKEILANDSAVFACYPFPGPPTPDEKPSRRRLTSLWHDVPFMQTCSPSYAQKQAFCYNEVSTRVLLFDKRRFTSRSLTLPLARPRMRRLARSYWIKTGPYLLLEDCLTVLMNERGLHSVGFLGSGHGVWSLHPRWRSKQFYDDLKSIIRRVENGDIPDRQRGDFDMNSSMIDLTDIFEQMTRMRRFRKELRLIAFGLAERLGGS